MFFFQRKVRIPEKLKNFHAVFEKNGFKAYLVGGAVRDIFLHKNPSDWDVATNATPQDVVKIFKFVVPTGIDHGTVTVHFQKSEIEVTTFRTEAGYSDGRHPDKVNYAATIQDDLSRRDFTINAIAVNLKNGLIVDTFHGRKDIRKKIIRTVGNPHERFMEDGLRPIRAIRFSSKLHFSIENNTYSEIFDKEVQKKISSISAERFRDELMKMMETEKPSVALNLMEKTGIFGIFLPQLLPCRNCIQRDDRGFHVFDVMDHIFYACDGAPAEKPLVRFAALLHDCGKPASKVEKIVDGMKLNTFYNHDKASSEIAREIMTGLKFSNAQTDYVCHLIENHMFNYTPDWTDAAVRRFLAKVGVEYVDDLIELRLADMYGKYNMPVRVHDSAACELLIELKERIKKIQEKNCVISLKNLAVNGKDLIASGIPAGKRLGAILNHLLDCVIEDPNLNTREKLLEIAGSFSG